MSVTVTNEKGRIVFMGDEDTAQNYVSLTADPSLYKTLPANEGAERSFNSSTDEAVVRALLAQSKIHGSITVDQVLEATGREGERNRWTAYYNAVKEGSSNRKWDSVWWKEINVRKAQVLRAIAASQ